MHFGLCLWRMRVFLRGHEGDFPGRNIPYFTALTLLELKQTKQTTKPNKPLSETAECSGSGIWRLAPSALSPVASDWRRCQHKRDTGANWTWIPGNQTRLPPASFPAVCSQKQEVGERRPLWRCLLRVAPRFAEFSALDTFNVISTDEAA